jgi:hypothetical protein
MVIHTTCGRCGQKIQAPDASAGKKGQCPKCGAKTQIPGAGPGPGEKAKTQVPPLEKPAGRTSVPSIAGQPTAQMPIEMAMPAGETAFGAAPPVLAPPSPRPESDDLIAVPPIGVQTPAGMSAHRRKAIAQAYRWQRTLANASRAVGIVIGLLSLMLGTVALLVMVMQGGREQLVPGLGVFFFMLIVGVLATSVGLLARHMLLMLANLAEESRKQQDMLDQISERLR